jgi:hypothetical protein
MTGGGRARRSGYPPGVSRRGVSRWFEAALRPLCARLFIVAVAVVLVTPAMVHLFMPHRSEPSENRRFATWPAAPRSLDEALALPSRIDAYIQDHFGLRARMIATHNRLKYALFGEMPTQQVIEGDGGRLFFTSHAATTPFKLIETVCGVDVEDADIEESARSSARLIEHLRAVTPDSLLLIAPTAPVVYTEDLPDWLERKCRQAEPTATRVAARLPEAAKAGWVYPLEEALRLKPAMDVYPHTFFHWLGAAPRRIVESIAEQRLGLVKRTDVPTVLKSVGSDLGQFLAGLQFTSHAPIPDWRRAGIEACTGPACFPELGEIAGLLEDVSRYRTPGAGGTRILVLSDSFGMNAAGYFSQYVGEVRHFNVNTLRTLSAGQVGRFKRFAFAEYDPDIVVAIFQDGGLLIGPEQLNQGLWPEEAAAADPPR